MLDEIRLNYELNPLTKNEQQVKYRYMLVLTTYGRHIHSQRLIIGIM